MNLTEDQKKQGNEAIDILSWEIENISKFSVNNDDIFNAQVGRLEDLVKELRRQLI